MVPFPFRLSAKTTLFAILFEICSCLSRDYIRKNMKYIWRTKKCTWRLLLTRVSLISYQKAYSEPCQKSKMELSSKNVRQGSEYVSECFIILYVSLLLLLLLNLRWPTKVTKCDAIHLHLNQITCHTSCLFRWGKAKSIHSQVSWFLFYNLSLKKVLTSDFENFRWLLRGTSNISLVTAEAYLESWQTSALELSWGK